MVFSELIKQLPLADMPFEGVVGHMLQGENGLVIFMEFTVDAVVPPHHHGAQWGTVVAGELELTISGETRLCRPGDTYAIAAGEVHAARIKAGTHVVEYFEERDRYSVRAVD